MLKLNAIVGLCARRWSSSVLYCKYSQLLYWGISAVSCAIDNIALSIISTTIQSRTYFCTMQCLINCFWCNDFNCYDKARNCVNSVPLCIWIHHNVLCYWLISVGTWADGGTERCLCRYIIVTHSAQNFFLGRPPSPHTRLFHKYEGTTCPQP